MTEKQRNFIFWICETVGIEYNYEDTKQDASKFIGENVEMAKLMSSSNWALSNGYF